MSRIIPAIDIIEGQCVRLTKGDYDTKKVYAQNVVDVAKKFEDLGVKHLHVVDLDGAKARKPRNLHLVKEIIEETSLKVDFGGGVKTRDSLDEALSMGVHQVTLGSVAVSAPDLVIECLEAFGAEKIIIGADSNHGKIAIQGWQEESSVDLMDFIHDYMAKGAEYFVCTDIQKDGMLQGSSQELYADILNRFPRIKLVASGGVTTIEEVRALSDMKVDGIIIGKALYEGRIKIEEALKYENRSHAG